MRSLLPLPVVACLFLSLGACDRFQRPRTAFSGDASLAYVKTHMETGPETPHFNYTHFYLAQALHQQGGTVWDDYFPRIRGELLRTQSAKGAWQSTYGQAYATALSLLILEIPYRYLPIYER